MFPNACSWKMVILYVIRNHFHWDAMIKSVILTFHLFWNISVIDRYIFVIFVYQINKISLYLHVLLTSSRHINCSLISCLCFSILVEIQIVHGTEPMISYSKSNVAQTFSFRNFFLLCYLGKEALWIKQIYFGLMHFSMYVCNLFIIHVLEYNSRKLWCLLIFRNMSEAASWWVYFSKDHIDLESCWWLMD